MKINDGISDWFRVCVMAAVCCLALFGMNECAESGKKERDQWVKDNPVDSAKERCYSKIRGSRPACWSEGDWKVFCERVQCKQQ